jgi:biotin transport system substrate-specific component
VVGNIIIYACGVAWLAMLSDLAFAIEKGLMPFLVWDAVKIALGAVTLPLAWHLIGRRSR